MNASASESFKVVTGIVLIVRTRVISALYFKEQKRYFRFGEVRSLGGQTVGKCVQLQRV